MEHGILRGVSGPDVPTLNSHPIRRRQEPWKNKAQQACKKHSKVNIFDLTRCGSDKSLESLVRLLSLHLLVDLEGNNGKKSQAN